MKGKLVILDGIDGSGITTQSRLLAQTLKNKKKKIFLTKEPFDKTIIKLINKNQDPLIDFFYFLIDRIFHYKKIQNYLNKGFIVICSRSFPSTFAYQYYSTNLKRYFKEDLIFYLNHLSMNHIKPDLIIILDVSVKKALERLKIKKKKSLINKFEKKKFLEKAKRGFIYFAKKYNWQIVDSNESIEKVFNKIYSLVSKILENG